MSIQQTSAVGAGPATRVAGRRAARPDESFLRFPLSYKGSAYCVTGVIVAGFLLQLQFGPLDWHLLRRPVNLLAGAALVFCAAMALPFRRSGLVRWLSGVPLSVCLIAALLAFSLLMGVIPQAARLSGHSHDPLRLLGLLQVTASWPFALLYGWTLFSLALVILGRLTAFRRADIAFYLNHAGLWLVLFAAGFGAADMQRHVMYVTEGEVEWRVYNEAQEALELPLAIRLKDFRMEEHPPRLAVINRADGEVQPPGRPAMLQLGGDAAGARLGDWDVSVAEYIHQAVRTSGGGYRELPMPASAPAARVVAVHALTGETKQGWVCAGTAAEFFSALGLDDTSTLVMTQPEPSLFQSDITVLTEDGGRTDALLEVNKPLRVGNWMIYQYGYDTGAGKMSSYSAMELVYDPWIWPVYAGLALMTLGALCLIVSGGRKRRAA